jgi:hypothetical protein
MSSWARSSGWSGLLLLFSHSLPPTLFCCLFVILSPLETPIFLERKFSAIFSDYEDNVSSFEKLKQSSTIQKSWQI